MNIIKSFRNLISAVKNSDRLWVLKAYLRGKVLRQKAYRPQGNMFRLSVSVTAKRIMMLMSWWGFRPMTAEEVLKLMLEQQPAPTSRVPFVEWDSEGSKPDLSWGSPRDRWGDRSSFLALRK